MVEGDSSEMGVSNVFMRLKQSVGKVRVLEGGSGSSKTFSIIQFLIIYCKEHVDQGKRILIVRQKLTWLKVSVLMDFIKILAIFGVHNPKYNKTEGVLTLFGNYILFTGLDEPQKVHGPRWDVFWGNEAMELGYDDVRQVMMRTNDYVILDYNPSATDHWIYDRVIPRDDCTFILSTLLDNPFLPKEQRKEIMSYEPTPENINQGTADSDYWQIYGLGKRANIKGVIFPHVEYVIKMPEYPKWKIYCLDFGYANDPTALVEMAYFQGGLYFDEKIYERGLVNVPIEDFKSGEVADNIHDKLIAAGVRMDYDEIYADSSEEKSIRELQMKGWAVFGASKGPDSIVNGIDILKRYPLKITESSLNFKKEQKNYKWTVNPSDSSGKSYLNKPVDKFNHCWDAVRYGALEKIGDPTDFYMEPMN